MLQDYYMSVHPRYAFCILSQIVEKDPSLVQTLPPRH